MDIQISNLERQRSILALLNEKKRINVASLCEIYGISEATARRDLETLADEGRIQRVHGGAIALDKASPELPILQRERQQTGEKERIGRVAAQLVKDGETIFLGSGSTVHAIACHLTDHKGLTVLTNSLPITNELVGCAGIDLVILGGTLRDSELSFIGHITEQALSEVRADQVFIGARAVSLEKGITNDYMAETLTDRAIINIGQKVILAADHTKFGQLSTAFLAPIETFDLIVTDRGIDREYVLGLEERGISITLA